MAVSPRAAGRGELEGALVLANRILGFVNAPALMQRVVAGAPTTSAWISPPMPGAGNCFATCSLRRGISSSSPRGPSTSFPRPPGGMIWRPWPASRRKISWRCRGGASAGPVISAWPFAWRRRSSRPRPRGLPGPGKRCWVRGVRGESLVAEDFQPGVPVTALHRLYPVGSSARIHVVILSEARSRIFV